MQHPDEGTIHAWLDGALPPDEGARLEAHVAECAECAAAVAEARGLIAASSRILSALDDVPGGVVPDERPSALGRVPAEGGRVPSATDPGVIPLRTPAPPLLPFRVSRRFMAAAAVLLAVGVSSTLLFRDGLRPFDVQKRGEAYSVADTGAAGSATSAPVSPLAVAQSSTPPASPTAAPRAEGATGATVAAPPSRVANAPAPRDPGADSVVAASAAPLATSVAAADASVPVAAGLRQRLETAPPPVETRDLAAAGAARAEAAPAAAPAVGRAAERRAVVRADAPQSQGAAALSAAPGAVTGEVIGRVVDAQTGQGLAGVLVSVSGTERATQSAADGTFRLADVPVGPAQVQARRIGYQIAGVAVTVPPGGPTSVDLALRAGTAQLSDVVVTGSGGRASRVPVRKGLDSPTVVGCWELTQAPWLGTAPELTRVRLDADGRVVARGSRTGSGGTWTLLPFDSVLVSIRITVDSDRVSQPVQLRLALTGAELRGVAEGRMSGDVAARRGAGCP